MAKILIATEKPFAKIAVDGIKEVAETAGLEVVLLEKYTEKGTTSGGSGRRGSHDNPQ